MYLHEENDGLDVQVQESKRCHTLSTVVRELMQGLSMQEFYAKLEPFLRNVVREEVERVILPYIQSSPRPSINQIEASGSRGWQLHFIGTLPSTFFTNSKIEAENGTPIRIVICDASSKSFITSGPLSSVKVDIVVLDGDFGEQEDWTAEQFHASVICEREGKRPLLTGNLVVTLRGGEGYLGDIAFTDNSSWIRSRKFRLGARVNRSFSSEERIREARSEAFIVKDHRGELYKKHYPPSFGDEVWRLEKIGKDGSFHNRLAAHGIKTVQDFLRYLITDQSFLRSIFGNGMSNKTWDTIVDHAKTCVLDNKLYMYCDGGKRVGLLFNSIYNVLGIIFDGHSYQPLDDLTASQMICVERLKQHAYRNMKEMIEIDGPLNDGNLRQLPVPPAASLQGSSQALQHPDFPIILQEQLPMQPGFNSLTNISASVMEGHGELEETAVTQGHHSVQVCTPIQRNSFNMNDSCIGPYVKDGNEWAPGGPLVPAVSAGHLAGDDISQVQWQGLFPVDTSWGQGNGMFVDSSEEANMGLLSSLPDLSVQIPRTCKPNMGWFKLRAAIKWGISVRRDVAARRRASLPQFYQYC
ncbi:calmodulin-binding protein 60 D-like isoform X2 [Macadamia integrifolia]|uniref:calmodulin-binding protein 60 D-like isoform X2 n=1 Tax=Macadamia integrifolia TaxID=60698 RepID=UPI001C5005A6|nr:calmodulin-binding protein 60 D-like isoform X2 [Macadamia integrifolia]XP_042514422.1 calmodulin-binding protein 60 D-like isoform X2 [Macadamia integrifolia]